MNSTLHKSALLALVFRALFAAGFMPVAADSGWLIALCHQGLPAGILDTSDGHHQHHGDGQDSDDLVDSSRFCPLGGGLDQPGLALDLTPSFIEIQLSRAPITTPIRRSSVRLSLTPPIRAPPHYS